jgi:hypothetical protein
MMLDKDNQLSKTNVSSYFLTNRAAFNARAKEIVDEEIIFWGDEVFGIKPVTQEDVDYLLSIIASSSGIAHGYEDRGLDRDLWNIISEGASDYFKGQSTSQNAARIIQSRAAMLVSERGY